MYIYMYIYVYIYIYVHICIYGSPHISPRFFILKAHSQTGEARLRRRFQRLAGPPATCRHGSAPRPSACREPRANIDLQYVCICI